MTVTPTLLSVNVGLPKNVAWQGKTVYTGAWKHPVDGPASPGCPRYWCPTTVPVSTCASCAKGASRPATGSSRPGPAPAR